MGRVLIFSGIQPTGTLHLGNYFGAVRNWVRLQEDHPCLFCIVDLHAMTSGLDGPRLAGRAEELARVLIACGIDPDRSILFVQSHVPEHAELAWILQCVTPFGDLSRMTQFKEKSERVELVNAGLFTYPVLQAADILLYGASRVPVGEDQVQHLELCRRIARRFHAAVGAEIFPEVEPILFPGGRILSLADPARKMSKSLGPDHFVGILEPEGSLKRKIRSAVTDTGRKPGVKPGPGVENLMVLLDLCGGEAEAREFRDRHAAGKLLYRDLKDSLAQRLEKTLAPIRERYRSIPAGTVREVLARGAGRAEEIARATMERVRRLAGVGRPGPDPGPPPYPPGAEGRQKG